MQHRFRSFLVALPCLALAVACEKSEALVPTVPTPTAVSPADGATLKATSPTPQSPINDIRLESLDTPTLTANGSSPTQGGDFTSQYRFQLLDESGTTVISDSGLRSSPNWRPPVALAIDTKYTWRVRAEYDGNVTAWSALAAFISLNAGFKRGQEVYDPLINGQTVGFAQGGHFVPGPNGGWQADSLKDGLIYDIPTCEACRVEFDVTNFGKGEGRDILKDVKWFSMGDATTWGNFGAFRNHKWKMHLEQRSDGDGTGMQVIWRNGKEGDDAKFLGKQGLALRHRVDGLQLPDPRGATRGSDGSVLPWTSPGLRYISSKQALRTREPSHRARLFAARRIDGGRALPKRADYTAIGQKNRFPRPINPCFQGVRCEMPETPWNWDKWATYQS
jgi:hypothetical protein